MFKPFSISLPQYCLWLAGENYAVCFYNLGLVLAPAVGLVISIGIRKLRCMVIISVDMQLSLSSDVFKRPDIVIQRFSCDPASALGYISAPYIDDRYITSLGFVCQYVYSTRPVQWNIQGIFDNFQIGMIADG